ncbi:MAG: zf-HC2 domain-containing protein, partial [Candidatus Acidiferrales bacterium]
MDAREENESEARRRDEALARRMSEALDRLSPRDAAECPDAELIAAYHERTLQPNENARCEGHFAACSRCRKILAVLAASNDAPLAETEVARLGEQVAASSRPAARLTSSKGKHVPGHKIDWRARWLAPALGVAAALAVWFAMRAPWRSTVPHPTETLVAQAPKIETRAETSQESADQLSKSAPEPNPSGKSTPSLDHSSGKAPSPDSRLEARNTPRADFEN